MYIEPTDTYYLGTEQHARRARFLLLLQPQDNWQNEPIKAVVRKVALSQCGNWMMGKATIYGKQFTVSGSYGADGLPLTVDNQTYARATVVLPDYLLEAWQHGGGWNSAGSEAAEMIRWAQENLKELEK